MSADVENRIVEMQFDNAQFKQGVAETIQKIKELDSSLKLEDSATGFEKVADAVRKVDVSNIADGADKALGRLNTLKQGAIGVISEIGSVMKGGLIGGGIIGAITSLPVIAKSISGGMARAGKLAQAEFQFEGLGVQGEELAKIMDRVGESVNDTAYGLDQASTVASMLFASGVQDIDQLGNALDNVSNVAATFNADYESIADVMSKVASKGKMQGEEFQQLAHKGMNAKAVIAEFLRTEEGAAKYSGLIEQFGDTEAAVDEMSSKGVISFELFNDSLSKFAGNAKKSNQTLQGVTANIGAALSRTTADFFQYTLHNVDGVIKVLNDVRTVINSLNKATNGLMHVVKNENGEVIEYGIVIQGVLDVLKSVSKAFEELNTTMSLSGSGLPLYAERWKEFFDEISPLIKGFFDRAAQIALPMTQIFFRVFGIIREVLRGIFAIVTPVIEAFDSVFGDAIVNTFNTLANITNVVIRALRELQPAKSTIDMIRLAFTGLFSVVKVVADLFSGVLYIAFDLFITQLRLVYGIVTGASEIFMALVDALSPLGEVFMEILDLLLAPLGSAGEGILRFFDDLKRGSLDFVNAVKNAAPAIKAFFEPLKKFMTDIANGIRQSDIFKFLQANVPKVVSAIGSAIDSILPGLQALYEFLKPVGEAIGDTFVKAFEGFGNIIQNSGILDFFGAIGSKISDFLGVSKAFADMGDGADGAAEGLDAFGQRFGEAAVKARDGAIELGGKALDALVNIATTIWNIVSPALEWLGELFGQIATVVSNAFNNSDFSFEPFLEFFANVGEKIQEFFKLFEDGAPTLDDFLEFFGEIKDLFGELISSVAPQFAGFMENIGNEVSGTTEGPLADIGNFVLFLADNLQRIPDIISSIPSTIGDTLTEAFNGVTGLIRNPFAVEKAYADTGEGGLGEAIDTYHEEAFNLASAIENITVFLKKPLDTAQKVAKEGFTGVMRGIGDAIDEGLGAINFETINLFIENCKNVIVSAAAIWGTVSLVSVFESIREIFSGVRQWTQDISKILNSVSGVLAAVKGVFDTISTNINKIGDAVSKDIKANVFLKYMLGTIALIGTLVAAIVILGKMPREELIQGGVAVGILIGVLLVYQVLMNLISKIGNEGGATAALAGLTGMGFALLMLARSVQKLGDMDQGQLTQGLIAVGVLMILVGLLSALVGAVSEHGAGGAAAMLALALTLKLMTTTLAVYSVMPWDFYLQGVWKMIALMTALAIFARVIGKAGKGFYKAAPALVAVSVSLGLMAGAVMLLNLATLGDPGLAIRMMGTLALGLVVVAGSLTVLSKFGDKIWQATGAIAAISACLSMIALAIGILNFVTMGNPITAVTMAGVLVGTLLGLALAIILIGKKTRQLPNATTAIFNMTVAVVAIGAVLAALTFIASWNMGAFIASAITLGLLMATLAGVIIIIGRQGRSIESAIPAIFQMTLAIAAIGAAVAAMTLLSGGNIASIAVAGVTLAGVLIVMAVAIRMLAGVEGMAAAAASSMLILAAALGVMALSIAVLGSLSIGQVIQGFIALVAALVILGAAAAIVSAVSEFFFIFDGVLIGLGVALVLIAGSFYLFVAALAELGRVAPETFQSIIDSKDQMVGAFSAMGEAVAAGILSFFGALITGVGNGISEVASTVESRGPEIGTAARNVGKLLVEGIIFGIGGAIMGVGEAVVTGIGNALTGANQSIVAQGGAVTQEMADAMATHPEIYGQAGTAAIEQTADGMTQSDAPQKAGEEVIHQTDEAMQAEAQQVDSSKYIDEMFGGEGGIEIPEEFKDSIHQMMAPENFENIGLDLGNLIPQNINEGASASPINPAELMSNMNLTPENFTGDAESVGQGIGQSVSEGAAQTMSDTSPIESAVSAQLEVVRGQTGNYETAGMESGTAYGTGVNTGITTTDISPSVAGNTTKMAAELGPAISAGSSVGQGFSQGEASGIWAFAGSVASAARGITSGASGSANGWGSGYEVGDAFGQGLYNGIDAWIGPICSEAARMVREAKSAAKEEENANSPSKDTYEYGEWFGEGFALGIHSTGKMVGAAASDMVVMAKDEAQTAFGVMDSIFDLIDWDTNPTITPVLDLSEYDAGLARMRGLDTDPQIRKAGYATRIFDTMSGDSGSGNQNGGDTFEIHLDWQAGTSANQMVQMLANEIALYRSTEGR